MIARYAQLERQYSRRMAVCYPVAALLWALALMAIPYDVVPLANPDRVGIPGHLTLLPEVDIIPDEVAEEHRTAAPRPSAPSDFEAIDLDLVEVPMAEPVPEPKSSTEEIRAEPREERVEMLVQQPPQIGSLRIAGVSGDEASVLIAVAIEANLARRDGTSNAVERWTFVRAGGVKTKAPARTRTWPCPSCGAPWAAGLALYTCAHCGESVARGRMDWAVSEIVVETETSVGVTLTGTTEEIGNDFPTVVSAGAPERLMQLRKDDPSFAWDAFTARVTLIYVASPRPGTRKT